MCNQLNMHSKKKLIGVCFVTKYIWKEPPLTDNINIKKIIKRTYSFIFMFLEVLKILVVHNIFKKAQAPNLNS